MSLTNKRIGICLTGSFCTFERVIVQIQRLIDLGADVLPIMSENAYSWDTRFGTAVKWQKELTQITDKKILHTVIDVEPIGPGKIPLDLLVVAPATGNTLAALSLGLTDGSVPMACKAHWRNNKPVVLAISTNDGLGANATSIACLHNKALTYLVPYGQDNPQLKAKSLVAHFEYLPETITAALEGKQFQPVLIPHNI